MKRLRDIAVWPKQGDTAVTAPDYIISTFAWYFKIFVSAFLVYMLGGGMAK